MDTFHYQVAVVAAALSTDRNEPLISPSLPVSCQVGGDTARYVIGAVVGVGGGGWSSFQSV